MTRPRRPRPSGPIHGDNNREVSEIQVALAAPLRAWLESIGSQKDIARRLRFPPSYMSKIINCRTLLPRDVAAVWTKKLRLTKVEGQALADACILCHADPEALGVVDKRWRAVVDDLAQCFADCARRRRRRKLVAE